MLIWAAVIFTGSGDLLSEGRTSRFIGPVLRWFKPDLSDAAVRQLQGIIRKGGHVTEYGVLALLCLRALTRSSRLVAPVRSWPTAVRVLVICALYAVSDEIHQSFVPSRYGSSWDVLIDVLGAASGLAVAWLNAVWVGSMRSGAADTVQRLRPAKDGPGVAVQGD